MLRSGKEHLASLRDGRVVYIGGERVGDVTAHPAFRNAARTVAAMYDMKADPANRETMTYEEEGGRHSIYFLRAKDRDDLQRRMVGHRKIADMSYGHVRPLAGPRRELRDRHGDEARRARPAVRQRRQPGRLLPSPPRRGRVRGIRRAPAAGGPQPGVLPAAEPADPDPERGARGRRRRRDLRDEDARHRRGVRERDLDRQRPPARPRPEEAGDHVRDPVQREGAHAVVAEALRA